MTEDEKPAFAELVVKLFAAKGREASRAQLGAYWLGLSDLGMKDIEQACVRAIRGEEHIPSPRRLRELAGVMPDDLRALVAWNAVTAAIRAHGAYTTVAFSDPAITAAIRLTGGWRRLCGLGGEDLETWGRKEFERAYGELRASGVPANLARPLEGIWATQDRVDPASLAPRLISVGVAPVALLPATGPDEVIRGVLTEMGEKSA